MYVTIGGTTTKGSWSYAPDGGVGIYRGSVAFDAAITGNVAVEIKRGGTVVATMTGGKAIGECFDGGYANWNAYVGTGWSSATISATPAQTVEEQGCMEGTATAEGFKTLCEFTCQVDYCPIEACLCTKKGTPLAGGVRGDPGYPAEGRDVTYAGLCAVACSYGFCPSDYCSFTKYPTAIPTVSAFIFNPHACTSGGSLGAMADLCKFACGYGYCPLRAPCSCDSTGVHSHPRARRDRRRGYGRWPDAGRPGAM